MSRAHALTGLDRLLYWNVLMLINSRYGLRLNTIIAIKYLGFCDFLPKLFCLGNIYVHSSLLLFVLFYQLHTKLYTIYYIFVLG